MKIIKLILATLCLLFIVSVVNAGISENTASDNILNVSYVLPVKQFAKQSSYNILLELNIKKEWHINSNSPLKDFLIPTEIKFSNTDGVTFGKIQYMKPEMKKFSFSESAISVYEGRIYALTTITVSPDYKSTELFLEGSIYYQSCNDESCLAPDELEFSTIVPIVESGTEVEPLNTGLHNAILPKFQPQEVNDQDQELSDVVESSGLLYTFIFIFLGGLALNLTPCVYPLIPITISYFGGQSEGKKGALVLRAVIYVLGMAVTYSILGVVASLTGGLLGSALQNPLVLIFVALVLVALALSMFGLYEIRIPQSLAKIGGESRSGYFGTLFMGLTVGLIAAPCIGPFVLGLLTYVSEIGDPILGFWMFFILAIGLGTPFLFLGIFSGAVTHMPRSGAWMVWVRNIFGFILIGMAVYFIEPLFPGKLFYFYTLALLSFISGVYLGWIDKNTGKKVFVVIKNIVGVSFILLGIFFILPSGSDAVNQLFWQEYSEENFAEAIDSGKPVIIDFYADWCLPCKELDKFTFTDNRVKEYIGKFEILKADLTHFQSDETSQLRKRFDIKGVPTILFIKSDGTERKNLRLVGFEEADSFLNRMKRSIEN